MGRAFSRNEEVIGQAVLPAVFRFQPPGSKIQRSAFKGSEVK
jgi:hypothetical protein